MSKISMNKKVRIIYFNDLVEAYIKICKVRNLSPKTIAYYRMSAHIFNKYCGNPKLEEIDDEMITELILILKEQMKAVSINSRLRGMRAILNYGVTIGVIKIVKVPMVKYDKEAKEGYTDQEIRQLLVKPNINKCSFAEYRNWVMVNYLYGTSCRLATLINIKIKDIDLDNRLITNRHMKTRQQILTPLPTTLILVLREYLDMDTKTLHNMINYYISILGFILYKAHIQK